MGSGEQIIFQSLNEFLLFLSSSQVHATVLLYNTLGACYPNGYIHVQHATHYDKQN